MKRKKAISRCSDGVSPVVATILLVAMTVVLAAVLYVLVSSLIGSNPSVTPVMSTQKTTDVNGNHVWTIIAISSASTNPIQKTDVHIQLLNSSGFVIATEPMLDAGSTPGCDGTHGFKYQPANAGNNLGVGDTFTLDKAYDIGCTITLVNYDASALYAKFFV